MKLTPRTQCALLCTFLLVCAAIGPATMPIWRNAWSTNQPPRFVEGNNDLVVTNIPGKISYNFFVGGTNSIARKNDTSNDVVVAAGSVTTVSAAGAGGRMTYTVGSAALSDVGGGELAIIGTWTLLDSPQINLNNQSALQDNGGGIMGAGNGFSTIQLPSTVFVGGIAPAMGDNAGTLEVGFGAQNITIDLPIFGGDINIGGTPGRVFLLDPAFVSVSLQPSSDGAVPLGFDTARFSRLDTFAITNYSPNAYIPTNAAPANTITPAKLHSITINKGWTNDLGARADIVLSVKMTDAVTGDPALGFTNSITGEAWTNNMALGTASSMQYTIVIPDISPNDRGVFTNLSGTGASVLFLTAWWKLK